MTDDDARSGREDRERRACEVLAAYFEAEQGGARLARDELLRLHPELATELGAFLDEQDRLLNLTERMRSPDDDGPATACFGDYELFAPIGRGGMGVVFKARQRSLNRPVALKLTLNAGLAAGEDLRRFHVEAEAAASLDHPHIVPIYDVGEHQGQGYLSMKLIEGGNLSDIGARLANDPHTAARLVATVARAVHHAHQRGILHRDLKPSNIMLDRELVPYVADFGLARRVEGGDELTRSGDILGSPPYMAPEQASSDRRAVTTATDVYGLGTILYWLLTGRPPFQGDTAIEVLDQVRNQAPAPPAALNPRVDRDLQTICLKCLEKEPARRYATAEAVADDLDRWLAGEPIAARPVGRAERVWRWSRRNPVVAGLAAAILVLLVAGLIGTAVGVVAIDRERVLAVQQRAEADLQRARAVQQRAEADLQRARAVQERAEALRQRDQARIQREQARRAVDDMYIQVGRRWISRETELQPLQKQFLQKALDYYLSFADDPESDLATRKARAAAFLFVGEIHHRLGESAAAGAALDRAIADFTEALRLDPQSAEAYNRRGLAWGFKGDRPRQIADFTAAIQVDPEFGQAYVNRGYAARETHDYDPGIADFTKALRLNPKAIEAYIGRGILWRLKHHYDQAIADHTAAIEIDPKLPKAYFARAEDAEAKGDYDQAIADFTAVIRLDPKSAEAYQNRGRTWRHKKNDTQAGADFAEAARLDSKVTPPLAAPTGAVQRAPKTAGEFLNRGIARRDGKDYEQAIADFDEAIRINQNDPTPYFYRGLAWTDKQDFTRALADFNEVLRINRNDSEAASKRKFVQALAAATEAIRRDPGSPAAYFRRGMTYFSNNSFGRAITDLTEYIRLDPKSPEVYLKRGIAYQRNTDYDQAIADFDAALRLNPKRSEAYRSRGDAWLAKKQYARAVADYSEVIRLDPRAEYPRYARAAVRFILRDRGVAEDLNVVLEFTDGTHRDAPRAVILGCLAARVDKDDAQAREFLGPLAARLDASTWPYPAVRYLRGELDAAGLLAQADVNGIGKAGARIGAHSWIGLDLLARGQSEQALEHFRWVRDHPTPQFLWYWIALAELDRVASPAAPAQATAATPPASRPE